MVAQLKSGLRVCYDAAAWRRSNWAPLVRGQIGRRANLLGGYTDEQHLQAAGRWIAAAQDASGDGGIVGRYSLREGWTTSYPETTGYSVPSLIDLGLSTGNQEWLERAARAVDFLLGVQLPDGGFPGREIGQNRTEPSIFNTGQIICGLTAWYAHAQDERALTAALRAGEWMARCQEADGSWQKWLYGGSTPYTYMAYAAGWLAQLGQVAGRTDLLDAGAAHLEWVMGHRDAETGWFRDCGFAVAGHGAEEAFTHTIAYTLAGVLQISQLTGNDAGIAAVRDAAIRIARTMQLKRWLPGVLDRRWRGKSDYACLTGNAQMALVWFDLHELRPDPALVSAGCTAIDLVKLAQPMTSKTPGIYGGIPGSDPIWGDYIHLSYPNWAAKYFVDALLAKQRVMSELSVPQPTAALPAEVPLSIPAYDARKQNPLRVVLLAGSYEPRARDIARACENAAVWPTAVIVERGSDPSALSRSWDAVREYGVGFAVQKVRPRFSRSERAVADHAPTAAESMAEHCRKRGIEYHVVERLDSAEALDLLRRLDPDLAVHAGAGIIRDATLQIPRLGVINAHMGLLPWFRGMNVTEWSVLYGFPVGCTVHKIDAGVDTGDILCCRRVDTTPARSVQELRSMVDDAQLKLLGEVVAYTNSTGQLPPALPQRPDAGRQYFRLHAEVKELLERHLARRPVQPRLPGEQPASGQRSTCS